MGARSTLGEGPGTIARSWQATLKGTGLIAGRRQPQASAGHSIRDRLAQEASVLNANEETEATPAATFG
jgi:hypothetical protein